MNVQGLGAVWAGICISEKWKPKPPFHYGLDFIGQQVPKFWRWLCLSHACAWGAEMASSLALSTVDAPSSKERKPAFSMAEDSLC